MPRRSAEKEFFCSLAVLCNNPSVAENSSVLYLKVYQIQGLSVKAQRRTFSLSLFVTINASARAAVCVKSLKNTSYARLAHAYAGRIVTLIFVVYIYRFLRLFGLTLIGDKPEQLHYQSHAHEPAAARLLEIFCARVGVHVGRYLVDSRQGVQNAHIALCKAHLLFIEDIYAV